MIDNKFAGYRASDIRPVVLLDHGQSEVDARASNLRRGHGEACIELDEFQLAITFVALYGAAGAGNAKQPLGTDSPSQIRNVNLFVGARSNAAYSVTGQFFRDNMITKVGVRSLSFVNIYK